MSSITLVVKCVVSLGSEKRCDIMLKSHVDNLLLCKCNLHALKHFYLLI